jgi:RimJ/RimL family protein N-acetyltransferase
LLEGKTVNLRNASKEDVSTVMRWWSDPQYMGKYQDTRMLPREELEKVMLENTIFFIIEKKDGMMIGHIGSWKLGRTMEMGFALVPSERRKGYGEGAIQLMVDYLFLTKYVVRIQASTDAENNASQRALERVGFTKEAIMRKYRYTRGEYKDHYLYSILREDWKEPKILTKAP